MDNDELLNKMILALNKNTAQLQKLAEHQNKVNTAINLNTKQVDVLTDELKEMKKEMQESKSKRRVGF